MSDFVHTVAAAQPETPQTVDRGNGLTYLSLDTVRNLQGDSAILLSGEGRLQTVGKMHRFKSFFNLGTARAENRLLVERFKAALVNDPRYFALGERIDQLVGQIGTKRAVHAGTLRSIVAQLDSRSDTTSQRCDLYRLIPVRIAVRGVPESCRGYAQAYRDLAVKFIGDRANAALAERGVPLGRTDIAGELAVFDDLIDAIMKECGDDKVLKKVVGDHLSSSMVKPDASMRSKEECLKQVAGFRAALNEARTRAGRGECSQRPCFDAITQLSKAPKEGTFGACLDKAAAAVPKELEELKLADKSDVPAVHKALAKLATAAWNTVLDLAKNDPEATLSLTTLFVRTALDNLAPETRRKLDTFLRPEGAGANLARVYLGAQNPPVMLSNKLPGFVTTIRSILEQLSVSARVAEEGENGERSIDGVREEMFTRAESPLPKSAEEVGLAPADLYLVNADEVLTEDEKATAQVHHFAREHWLAPGQSRAFDLIRKGLADEGLADKEILAAVLDRNSPEAALMNHPDLLASCDSLAEARNRDGHPRRARGAPRRRRHPEAGTDGDGADGERRAVPAR